MQRHCLSSLQLMFDLIQYKVVVILKTKLESLTKLSIPYNKHSIPKSVRQIRKSMRQQSFDSWSQFPHKGKGVSVFQDDPTMNSWMNNRKGISSSEWTTAIKLSSNTAAVRSVPGRSTNTIQCRFPDCNDVETLGHVLGFCPKGELLRNTRHHRVRSTIASSLRDTGMEVYEEVHCLADDGSTRRVDILAIDKQEKKAVILDPTVRFEQDIQQAMVVDEEKRAIYLPCIPHLSESYKATDYTWEVYGLLFGARGSSYKYTRDILTKFKVTKTKIKDICIKILKDSIINYNTTHYHSNSWLLN